VKSGVNVFVKKNPLAVQRAGINPRSVHEICGGESGTRTAFSASSLVFPSVSLYQVQEGEAPITSRQSTHEGGKVVSPTYQLPLPHMKYSLEVQQTTVKLNSKPLQSLNTGGVHPNLTLFQAIPQSLCATSF
jgi:hypothetical protein